MKILNKFIFPHWFIQLPSKRFIMVELLFLYMLIGIGLGTYRAVVEGMNDITGLQFVDIIFYGPFLLGIAFQLYKYYAPKTKVLELPDSYWKTKLSILTSPDYKVFGNKTNTELELIASLKEDWLNEYDVSWEDKKMSKAQSKQPLLIGVVVIFIYLILQWI